MLEMVRPDMSDQFELLLAAQPAGAAYARASDPGTSHGAAASVRGEEANRVEGMVLDAIRASITGLICWEIVERTGLIYSTATPRLKPLVLKGLIRDSGLRRRSPSGRPCIVWVAVN